ncbi:MAG TPA: glycosyltransferase [Candidatus Marinimicrobia bacterium]|nr:glycosyltransferase [Candidatus Neomarinimicrobiota bacterium]
MRILQISCSDAGGGAERIALDLHREYLRQGHESMLLVCNKHSSIPDVSGLANGNALSWKIANLLLRKIAYYTGIQTGFKYLFDRWFKQNQIAWDVIHCHNLHGGYFPIEYLRTLSKISPVVITLHDEWLYTGHCAYTLGCERWLEGCGHCPRLQTYPPVLFDNTAATLTKRVTLLKELNPTLVSPSKWLAERVKRSKLNMFCNVISNGIDLDKFINIPKTIARTNLGFSQGLKLLLFVANGGLSNVYKDGTTMLEALRIVESHFNKAEVKLIVVGGGGGVPSDLGSSIIEAGKINQEEINQYYCAADILVYPTKADNFPLVLIEAMVCGTPIVVSDIGGCSEIVVNGKTGYVVEPDNARLIAVRIINVLKEDHTEMVQTGMKWAKSNFSLGKMTQNYLDLYHTITE